jgi:xanthine/uracil permease
MCININVLMLPASTGGMMRADLIQAALLVCGITTLIQVRHTTAAAPVRAAFVVAAPTAQCNS